MERLSTSDLAMLVPDEFGWPQDIGAVAILEGASLLDEAGQVRIERVRDTIAGRLDLVPRFRQILVEPRRGLGMPFWTDAPAFDIADHVRVLRLPAGAGEPELVAAFEELRARGFDRGKPLWEMWLMPGLTRDRVGLAIKLHHTVADGIAGVATFAAFLDSSPTAERPLAGAWQPRPRPTTRALLLDNLRQRLRELARPLRALLHPLRTLRLVGRIAPLLRETFREARAPRTSLTRVIGAHRGLVFVRSRLDVFKAIGHAHGAKVNDVLLAVIAGGLRELLLHRGDPVDDLVLRIAVPISVHAQPGAARGNRDSGMIVPLPIGEANDVRRLRAIAADTSERKRKPRPQFGAVAFPGARTLLRTFYRRMGKQRMVNAYAANIPGPPVPMYLAGAKLIELFPVVPLTGNTPLAIGAMSYAGQLAITIVADRAACPDVEVFATGIRHAIDALIAAPATVPASGRAAPRPAAGWQPAPGFAR